MSVRTFGVFFLLFFSKKKTNEKKTNGTLRERHAYHVDGYIDHPVTLLIFSSSSYNFADTLQLPARMPTAKVDVRRVIACDRYRIVSVETFYVYICP